MTITSEIPRYVVAQRPRGAHRDRPRHRMPEPLHVVMAAELARLTDPTQALALFLARAVTVTVSATVIVGASVAVAAVHR